MSSTTKPCVLVETMFQRWPAILEPLREKYNVVFWNDFEQNPDQHVDKINAIIGVYGQEVLMKHGRDESFFGKMPNLKVVCSIGRGTDNLDLPMLWSKGIRVGNSGSVNACCTAEMGFALMLASARNLKLSMRAYQDDVTIEVARNTYRGTRLLGSTLGIVGMGAIGYMVAERANAFKMRILYHNRNRLNDAEEKEVQATYCDTLDDLLGQSDFVMLCAPLNDETKGMIGARELQLMKSTAILINIARGGLVDQDALLKALQEKIIGGAALDVTTPEPLPSDHPLLHMPNVIVTPHYAGTTDESMKEVPKIVLDTLSAGLEGKPMPYEVKAKEQFCAL